MTATLAHAPSRCRMGARCLANECQAARSRATAAQRNWEEARDAEKKAAAEVLSAALRGKGAELDAAAARYVTSRELLDVAGEAYDASAGAAGLIGKVAR